MKRIIANVVWWSLVILAVAGVGCVAAGVVCFISIVTDEDRGFVIWTFVKYACLVVAAFAAVNLFHWAHDNRKKK